MRRAAAAGALAALYVLLFPYHPGLRSPNELVRLWQTRALVEDRGLALDGALRAWGPVGDMSRREGHYYSSKAPLLSFAAVPVYAVLRAVGGGPEGVRELPLVYLARLLLTVLPTLGLLVLVRRFLAAHVAPAVADAVTLAYALGTLAFSYSLLFMSHQPLAVLLFAGFYALWRGARGAWPWARAHAAAGACAGAALACEYTGALGVLGLVLYALLAAWGPREGRLARLGTRAGVAVLGALPFVLGLMAYHQAAFGHPLESGYKHLNDAAYQGWHVGGFLGIRLPDPVALWKSLVSPLRGLFVLSPFLLLALPGLAHLRRRGAGERPLFWLTVALLAGYGYFTASFSYESWGWTTGPRHLTGLVPFLLLPVALWLDAARDAGGWRAGVGAGAVLVAVLTTGALTLVNYVPDDVHNGLTGLALPLLGRGYLPPGALSLLGMPAPWAGLLPALLVPVLGAVAAVALLGRDRRGTALGALAGMVLLAGAFHVATSDVTRDAGAARFLQSVWLTPPGARLGNPP